jgi:hypothetical protein
LPPVTVKGNGNVRMAEAGPAGGDTGGVGELRYPADEPDQPDRPERVVLRASSAVAAGRGRFERFEPRSRTEYASELEQQAVSGWKHLRFTSGLAEPEDDPDRGPAGAPRSAETPDALRKSVRRFEPGRAGLPEGSADDAMAYIAARHGERPWLTVARGCSSDVQRVFAALDQSSGHAHIRHEGWVTEEMNERRVAYLEDPAQFDPAKRAAGIDGLREGDRPHQCRQTATRIIDPDAFAVAFVRGIEHPRVRAALETPFDPDDKPRPVQVPIEELLGPHGHRYCTGWRLEPIGGSMNMARRSRETWVASTDEQRASGLTQPTARPVETFEGGTAVFVFGHHGGSERYEVLTMYPRPPER